MKIARKYPIFLLLTTVGTSVAIFFALRGVLQTSIEKELTNRGETSARSFAAANARSCSRQQDAALRRSKRARRETIRRSSTPWWRTRRARSSRRSTARR